MNNDELWLALLATLGRMKLEPHFTARLRILALQAAALSKMHGWPDMADEFKKQSRRVTRGRKRGA